MYLTCMYPTVRRASAASDCCGKPADTIVELLNKSTSYRCPEHRGLVKGKVKGPARETMLTTQDVPDDIVVG
jgi:DNA-directed RNA polymerase subunit RPC12/RpoP